MATTQFLPYGFGGKPYAAWTAKTLAAVTPPTTQFLPYGFGGKPYAAPWLAHAPTGSIALVGPLYVETVGRITIQLALTVTSSTQALQPSGIASAAAFGTATIQRSAVSIAAAGGIASAEAFGALAIAAGLIVRPADIASLEAFGNTVVRGGTVAIGGVGGIASAERFGTALVYVPGVGRIAAVALSLSSRSVNITLE